ncbi:MAG TPA: oxidoreductase [Syntrophus sp. (in: bacteria)]|jgi:UDP-N-acetyl-2-amino-2-deoxyglucuronate dehydrogenase|nr:oxidoreductase [Syntrophus sp. (in: bacteria)]
MKNFALVGTAGYIAPRHLKAIADTGNKLVAATDPHDSVGILDRFFPDAAFFTEIERFDRHLEKLRRKEEDGRVKFVSICSPNYLHDSHIRLALRVKADAICEKPLVVNPWNLDALEELEHETGNRVWTILQLRVHPALTALKQQMEADSGGRKADIVLSYITRRGAWYHSSWKGSEEKSGGLVMNIGVHFFDMLIWLFGSVEGSQVHLRRPDKLSGALELERARVRWFLSVDAQDLPAEALAQGASAFRSITVDGSEIEFTEGFTDLHTRVYERILAGQGFGIRDAHPSIELVHKIRHSDISTDRSSLHPNLSR